MKKAFTNEQEETVSRAMEDLICIMHDVEETGKNKRLVQALDTVIGILYNLLNK